MQRMCKSDSIRHNELYRVIYVWFKLCEEFCIISSLAYGSLLGCIRHDGIIPWDEDADVCIFPQDYVTVNSPGFIRALNRWGYNLVKSGKPKNIPDQFCLRIYREKNISDLIPKPRSSPGVNQLKALGEGYLDVFIFRGFRDGDDELYYRPVGFKKYCEEKDKISYNEIYPLKTRNFGGYTVNIFNKSEDYLKRLYGQYCLKEAMEHSYNNLGKIHLKKVSSAFLNTHVPSVIDVNYWCGLYRQSLFADYVVEYIQSMGNALPQKLDLLDLGCGDNRDDYYFIRQGLNVTAVDSAVSECSGDLLKKGASLDVIKSDIIYFINKSIGRYHIIYCRFVLHGLTELDETLLMQKLYRYSSPGTYLFFEFRTPKDELYGKGIQLSENEFIYNNHYRRFIDLDKLAAKVTDIGFNINYQEQSNQFARYGNFKPTVARMVLIG